MPHHPIRRVTKERSLRSSVTVFSSLTSLVSVRFFVCVCVCAVLVLVLLTNGQLRADYVWRLRRGPVGEFEFHLAGSVLAFAVQPAQPGGLARGYLQRSHRQLSQVHCER